MYHIGMVGWLSFYESMQLSHLLSTWGYRRNTIALKLKADSRFVCLLSCTNWTDVVPPRCMANTQQTQLSEMG